MIGSSTSSSTFLSSIGQPKQRRASHTKSRAGCVSCKEKRVKCDQARPACTRCQRSHAQCRYHSPSTTPSLRFRAFRPSRLSSECRPHPIPPGHVDSSGSTPASVSQPIEYFCLRMLPVLRTSHPSALWDCLVVRLVSPGTSLYSIVAAIGAQQRLINDQDTCANSLPSLQARGLYARAVSSLRASITVSAHDDVDAHILPCLLMVVLESLRGSSNSLLMHLRCGLRILRGHTFGQSGDARDAARILQHYAAQSTLFNPLSSDAQSMRAILAELLWRGAAQADATCDPISALSASSTELIGLMADHYRDSQSWVTASPEMSGNLPTKMQLPLLRLENRRQDIELAIDARLSSTHRTNHAQSAVFNLAKCWCLLMKVFLTSAWTGRQTTYDGEIESFRRILDFAAIAIDQMKSSNSAGCDEGIATSTNFTVGFSIEGALLVVMHQCRDAAIRQQVLSLLDQCSQHEDSGNAALVKALCRAIFAFEGRGATYDETMIPEDRRIHHYLVLPKEKQQGASPVARLYYRPWGHIGFATCHVTLDVGSSGQPEQVYEETQV